MILNDVRPDLPVGEVVSTRVEWPLWKRVGFRFALPFWLMFDNGLWLVLWVWPWLRRHVSHWMDAPQEWLTIWTGKHVFHLSGEAATRHPTGSGDTALGWVGAFVMIVVSLVVCAVWTAISEARGRRREYNTLYAWLRLMLRFVLAATLFTYGFEKVFPLQMPAPSATTLAETYGASSPMRLAWTFIGASWQYRIFAGLCEVIPGFLLCFRRTSTLGAMGSAAVMLNVFVMNLGFDIPVKLYSGELLVMSLFLLLPDMGMLWRFFVRRQEAVLTGVWVRKPERKALRWAAHALQVLVIGNILFDTGVSSWKRWTGSKTELMGLWSLEQPSGPVADLHWKEINVFSATYVRVNLANSDKPSFFDSKISISTHTLELFKENDDGDLIKPAYATLHWSPAAAPAAGTTASSAEQHVSGVLDNKPVAFTMRKLVAPPSLLMTRGFDWVQEYPLNK